MNALEIELERITLTEALPRTGTTEAVTIFGRTTNGQDVGLTIRGEQITVLTDMLSVTVRVVVDPPIKR